MEAHPIAIDQVARDMIAELRADQRRHEAVCLETQKRILEIMETIKGSVASIQKAYETGQRDMQDRMLSLASDMNLRQSNAVKSVVESTTESHRTVTEDLAAFKEKTNEDVSNLYNRFWALSVSYGAGMTGVTGFLLIKLLWR